MGLERALGWGPRICECYLQERSRGWNSASGPEAGFPITGTEVCVRRTGWQLQAQRSYLESRARPTRGPRHAARPSAGNTPPRLRPAPTAVLARPPQPPWPLALPAGCAPLAAAAPGRGTAARSRRPMTTQHPARRRCPQETAPIRFTANQRLRQVAVANQRPLSRSQPRHAKGRAASGRSWEHPARPFPPRAKPGSRPTEARDAPPPSSVRLSASAMSAQHGHFFNPHCALLCASNSVGGLQEGPSAQHLLSALNKIS